MRMIFKFMGAAQPLQWGLGFLPEEMLLGFDQGNVAFSASMGPRVFTRGNMSSARAICWHRSALQWGLGFLPEEMAGTFLYIADNTLWLQWGLGFLPEEMPYLAVAQHNAGGCFNGASGFYPRKC